MDLVFGCEDYKDHDMGCNKFRSWSLSFYSGLFFRSRHTQKIENKSRIEKGHECTWMNRLMNNPTTFTTTTTTEEKKCNHQTDCKSNRDRHENWGRKEQDKNETA